MLCQETILPFNPQKQRINSTPLMETPKQYVLLDNVSTPIFFLGVVIFRISLICSAALFSVNSFPIHIYKIKNSRFLADLPLQKSPNPKIFYRSEGNSNQRYIQRPSEAWEQEENKNKNTPHKNKTKKSQKSTEVFSSNSVPCTASERGRPPNKWSQDTTKSLDCFFQCIIMMLCWEIPSGFWSSSVPTHEISSLPQVYLAPDSARGPQSSMQVLFLRFYWGKKITIVATSGFRRRENSS